MASQIQKNTTRKENAYCKKVAKRAKKREELETEWYESAEEAGDVERGPESVEDGNGGNDFGGAEAYQLNKDPPQPHSPQRNVPASAYPIRTPSPRSHHFYDSTSALIQPSVAHPPQLHPHSPSPRPLTTIETYSFPITPVHASPTNASPPHLHHPCPYISISHIPSLLNTGETHRHRLQQCSIAPIGIPLSILRSMTE